MEKIELDEYSKIKFDVRRVKLKLYEYVVDADSLAAEDYEVRYKGKVLKDVSRIIRVGGF